MYFAFLKVLALLPKDVMYPHTDIIIEMSHHIAKLD